MEMFSLTEIRRTQQNRTKEKKLAMRYNNTVKTLKND